MKILVITVLLLLLSPAMTAKAIQTEEGIAGIAAALDKVDELPDPAEVIATAQQAMIEQYIEDCSQMYEIDPDLVRAIIQCESEGEIRALNINTNGTRDCGLMQINSRNHKWLKQKLGITDFFDPSQNIKSGCYILADIKSRHTNIHKILMAYNMGEKRMKELWKEGIKSSSYSRKVIKVLNKIKGGTKDGIRIR